jgi:hypothetical protein
MLGILCPVRGPPTTVPDLARVTSMVTNKASFFSFLERDHSSREAASMHGGTVNKCIIVWMCLASRFSFICSRLIHLVSLDVYDETSSSERNTRERARDQRSAVSVTHTSQRTRCTQRRDDHSGLGLGHLACLGLTQTSCTFVTCVACHAHIRDIKCLRPLPSPIVSLPSTGPHVPVASGRAVVGCREAGAQKSFPPVTSSCTHMPATAIIASRPLLSSRFCMLRRPPSSLGFMPSGSKPRSPGV